MQNRLQFLDGLRGWAALVVVLCHVRSMFANLYPLPASLLLNFFTQGNLAICVFFVLSGFVLSIRHLRKPDNAALAEAATARYFRLIIPIAAINALAWLLLSCHLMHNADVANLSSPSPTAWLLHMYDFTPSTASYLSSTFLETFSQGSLYNTSLWTMPTELAGSLMVFALLAVASPRIRLLAILLITPVFFAFTPWLSCFLLGLGLAIIHHRYQPRLSALRYTNPACIALFCLPVAFQEIPFLLQGQGLTLRALAIVVAVTFSQSLHSCFACRLSRFLGAISFPLYLIHILVVCSLSSYVLLALAQHGVPMGAIMSLTLLLTLIVSIGLATLLLPQERFSIRMSKKIAAFILGNLPLCAAPPLHT